MIAGPILRVARVTLEAAAPLMIASGEPSATQDVVLARDPNGLPTIPGTALAGVLRSEFARIAGVDATAVLFGSALHERRDPHPGRVVVGDGLCIGAGGTVVDGLGAPPEDDPVFSLLLEGGALRDHVRLNDRGVVDGAGKFTRKAAPRGARFLAPFEFWDDAGEEHPGWRAFLDALMGAASRLRLGGATRSGYGAVRVIAVETRAFDMREEVDRRAARRCASLAVALDGAIERPATEARAFAQGASYVLRLVPEGPFRFGQGAPESRLRDGADPAERPQPQADLRPLRETVIDWRSGESPPSIEERLFMPASAVKGALRHRTGFHHRRLIGAFSDQSYDAAAALSPLFGSASDDDGANGPRGEAGRVFIEDAPLHGARTRRIERTSIDRFSGGVRRGALFSEDAVELEDAVTLRVGFGPVEGVCETLVTAFEHALADLAHGWLSLGAGGGRGLGAFRDPDPDPALVSRFRERIAG